MKKNIFVIGSRGYHANYGGWETLTSCLVDYYNDKDTTFYVTELTDDESLDKQIKKAGENVNVIYIYTKPVGGATMFLHSIKAFKFAIKYVENNQLSDNIENSTIFYILGLKLFRSLKSHKKKLEKLNIKTYLNPDGLEWKRSKWSWPVKKLFLMSESLMLKSSDCIICDAKGIKSYVDEKYPQVADKTTYIAYGAINYDFSTIDEKGILNQYNLEPNHYLLMVGRCVPEDNYELVINDFMKTNIDKDLVIITNLSSGGYYNELVEKTNCKTDKRIKFIDGIYDKEKLAAIRKNAFAYIHGHSVGGTNPSLIEALTLTDVNILFNVCFNRDIGQDACLYFEKPGSLTKILSNTDYIDENKEKFGQAAKKIASENFTWPIIVNEYKELFNDTACEK